jgi:hypothetical protein
MKRTKTKQGGAMLVFQTVQKTEKLNQVPVKQLAFSEYKKLVENAVNYALGANIWSNASEIKWVPGKTKYIDLGGFGKLSKDFNGELLITAKLGKSKGRLYNNTYDMQEKTLPREINTAILERVGEKAKDDYKVWSRGYTANDDGSVTFKFSVPYKLNHQ